MQDFPSEKQNSENLADPKAPTSQTEILPAKRVRKPRFPKLTRAQSLHELVPLIAASSSMTSVTIHKEAYFMMSLHAHLYHHEIIGWMAGKLTDGSLEIESAYPVKEIDHENGRINVEMDIDSAVSVRSEIEERGLSIVGWYHSHPTFDPDPSRLDIDNQLSYQKASENMFIGCIITPYLSTSKIEGILSLFNVQVNYEQHRRVGHHPAFSIRYSYLQSLLSQDAINRALKLIQSYKNLNKSINPSRVWKRGITYGQKLRLLLEKFELSPEQINDIYKSFID